MKPYGQNRTHACGYVTKYRNGGKIHFKIGSGAISKGRERRVGRVIMHQIATLGTEV